MEVFSFSNNLPPIISNACQKYISSAKIFIDILKGKGTQAQNAVVIANSAMAIHTAFPNKTIEECREMAIESLRSGKANQAFNTLLTL